MWKEISELPEGEGTYVVWMSKPTHGSHISVLRRRKIQNGYIDIIDGIFAFDRPNSKPLLFQTIVAPNYIPEE